MSVMLGMLAIVALLLGALWYLRTHSDAKIKSTSNEELWHLRLLAADGKRLAEEVILDLAAGPTAAQAQAFLDDHRSYERAKTMRSSR